MLSQLLYLAGSLAGVAAICGLCVALFGRGVASLDAGSAQARLAQDVAGFRAGRLALAADARSALVEDVRSGAVYLVMVRGDGLVTRSLSGGFVRAAAREGGALRFRFSDFTFPAARIDLGDEAVARDWEVRLGSAVA
jgi:hypothetical protein